MKRFQDHGELVRDFQDTLIVACPSCNKPVDYHREKFSCIHCGHIRPYLSSSENLLFLQIDCCGHTLRAFNLKHLDFIEQYIGAALRERTPNINKSLISRLPQWMKSAKHREEILKGIQKLKKRLQDAGYST